MAIIQVREAARSALKNKIKSISIELAIFKITFQSQSFNLDFTSIFKNISGLKVIFTEAGTVALTCRDWEKTSLLVTDFGSWIKSLKTQIFDHRVKLFDCFSFIGGSGDSGKIV
ncbi:MAG: hypothetical protein JJP05_02565 [cyanobacterium endosymbiont of Rhopalodia gibba]|jgi:hypothetical protein